MRKFYTLVCALTSTAVFAQSPIENGDFEDWYEDEIFESLDDWDDANEEVGFFAEIISKSEDAVSGNYSVYMETHELGEDTIFGFVLLGDLDGDGLIPQDGVPLTGTPDSIVGYWKYDIMPGDSANILVSTFGGTFPGFNGIKVGGEQSTWTRFSYPLSNGLGDNDSVLIAIASSDALAEFGIPGSWIMLDDVRIINTSGELTAGIDDPGFENWSSTTSEEPDGWFTFNAFLTSEDTAHIYKTADAYEGNYAMVLETMEIDGDTIHGLSTNGEFGEEGLTGGVPFNAIATDLSGYYKYAPQGNDTAYVGFYLWKDGNYILSEAAVMIGTVSTYTSFNIDLDYSETPDTMAIVLFSGENPGSKLWVDDLELSGGTVDVELIQLNALAVYPNPANQEVYVSFASPEAATVSIHNLMGELVHQQQDITSPSVRIDTEQFSAGIYTVQVQQGTKRTTEKLIITHP